MKRYIYGLLIALGLLIPALSLSTPVSVGATDIFNGICTGNNDSKTNASGTDVCQQEKNDAGNKQNPIVHVIGIAIEVVAFVIGIASVIVIMISGFQMITSNGDAQGVAKARSALIYALIGIAIALLAGTIVAVVLNNLS